MNTDREQMLQKIIQNNSLGALIFWRPDELVLLLGYMPQWGLSFLVYFADGDRVLYIPDLEPEDILPENINIRTFPWGDISNANTWKILYSDIRLELGKRKLIDKPVSFINSIGGTAPCRMSGEQPPLPSDLKEQLSAVSNGGYKDVYKELVELYLYKTKKDIEGIKLAHSAAEAAVRIFYENVEPGNSEAKIAGLIELTVKEFLEKDGIGYAQAWPLIQSGPNAIWGATYSRTGGRKLMAGEMVLLEMSVCVNGYWADITRTAKTSNISSEKEELFQVVFNAQREALNILKPKVPMAEVDAFARNYIHRAGYGKLYKHALGHHVGFRYHDPGPVLSPASLGVLEEGMVLTIEPGIYGKEINGGIRIEDNILITNNGYELLSDYPRSLSI